MRTTTYPIDPSGRFPVSSPSRTDSGALIVEVRLDDMNAVESRIISRGETLNEERMAHTLVGQGHRRALRVDVSATNPARDILCVEGTVGHAFMFRLRCRRTKNTWVSGRNQLTIKTHYSLS
jgi:hypothetical protein